MMMVDRKTNVFGPGERLHRKVQVVWACSTAERDDRTAWKISGLLLAMGAMAAIVIYLGGI